MITLILALCDAWCKMFGYNGFLHNNDALFCAGLFEAIIWIGVFGLIQAWRER